MSYRKPTTRCALTLVPLLMLSHSFAWAQSVNTGFSDTANIEQISLNQAVQNALKADPAISAAFESIYQAQANLLTAGLLPNPQINTDIQLMPLERDFMATRQGGPPQFDFIVSMPMDWFLFGKRAALLASAEGAVTVANHDFANTLRLKIATTISAFYDALEMQAQLRLAQDNQENLEKVQKIIEKRVSLGGVGTIESDRIRLSIFSGHRDVHARELDLANSLSQLRALLGITDYRPIELIGSLDVTAPVKPLALNQALTLAEENRPDIASFKAQMQKANLDLDVAERNAYPQLTPSVGFTRQFQQKAIGYPDVNSWMAGLNFSVPLFDQNQGNISKAKSIYNQLALTVSAQTLAVRSEIEQAVNAYISAYQFLTQDDPGQLDAAKNVRDKIYQAYELGGKTLIEVLDAQRAYLETYRVHISGRSNYWHALNQLNAAIGKEVVK